MIGVGDLGYGLRRNMDVLNKNQERSCAMSDSVRGCGVNERGMQEMTEINRICNRHKARVLQNLEDAGCPVVFRDAVASGLNWLRSDLNEYERHGGNTDEEIHGNR